jgi:tetratricopeptide (TPR) repeat protein
LKRAIEIEEAAGANRAKAADALLNLATLYRIQSRYAEAEPLLRRSLQVREKISGSADSETVRTLMTLGNLHRDQGNYGPAETLFRRALSLRATTLGEEHSDVASSLVAVGIVKNDQRQAAEALALCRRAAEIADKLETRPAPWAPKPGHASPRHICNRTNLTRARPRSNVAFKCFGHCLSNNPLGLRWP